MRYAAVLALVLVALAGCGGATKTDTTAPTTRPTTQPTAPKPPEEGAPATPEPPASREELENELRSAPEALAHTKNPEARSRLKGEISKLRQELSEARGR
jgi:hypothetical protein